MVDIVGGTIAFIWAISLMIQSILFYYLEISNDYDMYPYLRINLAVFTFYDKKVKPKDEGIKRVRNFFLNVSGYSIAAAILTNVILIIIR